MFGYKQNKPRQISMDEDLIKLCRACGKKNYVFCDVLHEVIRKLLKFVPSLVRSKEFPMNFFILTE